MRRSLAAAALLLAATPAVAAYQRGVAALETGKLRVARVELLNALKTDPANGQALLAQAEVHVRLGDGVAAEAELDRAAKAGVAPGAIRRWRGEALLLQGKSDRALAEVTAGPSLVPIHAMRVEARALAALGRDGEAEQVFTAAQAIAPEDAPLWIDLARHQLKLGNRGRAISAAARAAELGPRNIEALTLRGVLTRTQYGLKAALPWFDRAIALDEDALDARLERAATLGDIGRYRDMLAETRAALAIAPRHPRAMFLQAALAARARNFALARAILSRNAARLGRSPNVLLLTGATELEGGNPGGAIPALRALIAAQPDNLRARRLLGLAYLKSGDARAAIDALAPVAERPDGDSYSAALHAKALAAVGNKAAARAYAARADAPAGGGGLLLHTGGGGSGARGDAAAVRAAFLQGEAWPATASARRLQAENMGAHEAHLIAGDADTLAGRHAAAVDAYRIAANLAFTEPVALRLVDALQRSGDGPGSADTLSLFLAENPGSRAARMAAGNLELASGHPAAAIRHFERTRLRAGDGDAALLTNLAWAYWESGDRNRAIERAERAYLRAPRNAATADALGWMLWREGRQRSRALALLMRTGAPLDRAR